MEDAINQLYASPIAPLLHTNQTLLHPPPLYLHPSHQPFFEAIPDKEHNIFGLDDDEDFDSCLQQQQGSSSSNKKRRLRSEQVQFLEKSFEVENKLEPERKLQLAKEIGLHPRQVAIWFQNRRARFKTKRIEKDFATLKQSFDTLQQQYDLLLRDNHTLQQQVDSLKKRVIPREEENIEEMGTVKVVVEDGTTTTNSSSKSDVLDSDSPNYTDGNHSFSSHHDFSSHHHQQQQDNIDNNNNLLNLKTLSFLPKVEDGNTCNFGFNVVEDQAFDFWSY
ncbi:hypothetical protein PIB30_006782 [Stylosanthes scabra]|uniref:Homeobox-leucine zipper protein n=1 Tax=Stylosanthes scabra TaxID=79078 RepID=A0ABU6U4A0_9FABA|nr:hypothetical protein [Stylosanthes scabra]